MAKKTKSSNESNDLPWFADGLRFKCTGCGDCCTGAPGYVWVVQAEIDALAKRLGVTSEEFEGKYVRRVGIRRSLIELQNYDCVFLDPGTRKCVVYEDRPRQCRTWPFWQSNLQSPETWKETCEQCPGSGVGKLYSLDKIQAQAAEVRV